MAEEAGLFWRRRKATAPELVAEETETIEHSAQKTRESVFGRVSGSFRRAVIDEATWEELEELLVQSDMGPNLAFKLVEQAREMVEGEELKTPVEAETALRKQLVDSLGSEQPMLLEDLPGRVVVRHGGRQRIGEDHDLGKARGIPQTSR